MKRGEDGRLARKSAEAGTPPAQSPDAMFCAEFRVSSAPRHSEVASLLRHSGADGFDADS